MEREYGEEPFLSSSLGAFFALSASKILIDWLLTQMQQGDLNEESDGVGR